MALTHDLKKKLQSPPGKALEKAKTCKRASCLTLCKEHANEPVHLPGEAEPQGVVVAQPHAVLVHKLRPVHDLLAIDERAGVVQWCDVDPLDCLHPFHLAVGGLVCAVQCGAVVVLVPWVVLWRSSNKYQKKIVVREDLTKVNRKMGEFWRWARMGRKRGGIDFWQPLAIANPAKTSKKWVYRLSIFEFEPWPGTWDSPGYCATAAFFGVKV